MYSHRHESGLFLSASSLCFAAAASSSDAAIWVAAPARERHGPEREFRGIAL